MATEPFASRLAPINRFWPLLLLLLVVLLMSGCTASTANLPAVAPPVSAAGPVGAIPSIVAPLSAYAVPKPIATPTAPAQKDTLTVTVATQGVRANLRSGPGTSFAVITKAEPGSAFTVTAKSDDGRWYQVNFGAGDKAQKAWVSADIVKVGGTGDVPIAASTSEVLLNGDLSTQWKVDWSCNSERCEIKKCAADVAAKVNRQPSNNFLPVEHTVTWDDTCFNTDSWTFDVDQVTGKERTGEADQNFLYGYWLGANPGEANGVFPLDGKRGVVVHCSGPHSVEIEEGGGWTTVYDGNTCHDVKTGTLVYLSYTKRWLYTGDFEGKTYDRAYFGDSEKLEQKLAETNIELDFVEKK